MLEIDPDEAAGPGPGPRNSWVICFVHPVRIAMPPQPRIMVNAAVPRAVGLGNQGNPGDSLTVACPLPAAHPTWRKTAFAV